MDVMMLSHTACQRKISDAILPKQIFSTLCVEMLDNRFKELPSNKALILRNIDCPYCGKNLTNDIRTKEHVVARRFVPKGKLENNWNLILDACSDCNVSKSDLENDISAISLHHNFGAYPEEYDDEVTKDAKRKARNSISRRTRKPVESSKENFAFSAPIGPNASISFNMTGMPQVDEFRVFNLARLQLKAFFYFITYQQQESRGYCWTGEYLPFMVTRREDWGNTTWLTLQAPLLTGNLAL